jgi:hypothetical protein
MFPVKYEFHIHIESKGIFVTGRGVPHVWETLRFLHFLDIWLTDGSEVVRFTLRPSVLYP